MQHRFRRSFKCTFGGLRDVSCSLINVPMGNIKTETKSCQIVSGRGCGATDGGNESGDKRARGDNSAPDSRGSP